MKRLVTFLTTAILAIACVGCSTNASNNSSSGFSSSSNSDNSNGEDMLVYNGTSEYKIVLAEEPTDDEEEASWELEDLFKEATSVTLKTVYESEVTYSDTAKLILIGNTQYTEYADVDVDEIPIDGFTVKTVGSNLFIIGKRAGAVYGVHKFLEKTFGYEYYVDNVYALNKDVKNVRMPELDISDAPDIEYRADGWGSESSQTSYRSGTRSYYDVFMSGIYPAVHNTFNWLPKATYEGTHSAWYADDGSQLCYTAHGNATELAAMQSTVLEKFKEQVNFYFSRGDYRQAISFTQQDATGTWCSCAACSADIQTYGAESASIIRFLNPIAKQFKAWLAETYPGHEVDIVFFAYQRTVEAPVKTESGKLVPTDNSLVMEDNLAVWLAPMGGIFNRSINDAINIDMYNSFKNWSAVSKNLYVWCYDTNFRHYFLWYDSFKALPDLYKYLEEFNVKYMFNQGQYDSGSQFTGFDALKAALNYKLMWDADTDVEAFTDRFFKAWFGVASVDMRNYYDSFITWSETMKVEQNYNGLVLAVDYTKNHYPLNKLQEWQGYIEDAYESIEGLKTSDPDLYEVLYKRIKAEGLSIRFVLIRLHSDSFTADEVLAMKQSFKEDASELGFTRSGEATPLDTLYQSWGV